MKHEMLSLFLNLNKSTNPAKRQPWFAYIYSFYQLGNKQSSINSKIRIVIRQQYLQLIQIYQSVTYPENFNDIGKLLSIIIIDINWKYRYAPAFICPSPDLPSHFTKTYMKYLTRSFKLIETHLSFIIIFVMILYWL